MAGVPGLTPEQRRAYVEAEAGPGGTVREEHRAGLTDYVPVPARDTERSLLGRVGEFADKYLGFGNDRRRSRILSGVASQWYGLDEGGNPTFGKTPGVVYETQALGAVPTMLLRAVMDKGVETFGPLYGLPKDAPADPTYQMVQQALIGDPEWATRAMEKADAIHQAVREDMKLKAPKGFEENAQESLGVMFGQLPIPGKAATKAVEGAAKAPSVLNRLGTAAEWFTPTVRPSPGNYAVGTGVGAGLGTLADEGEEEDIPTMLPDPEQEGLTHVRPVYSDNTVGYSGHPDDQKALQELEQLLAAEQGHADGGRVGTLDKLIQKYLRDNTEGAYIGNSKRYLDLVRRHVRSVPDNEETELLEDYVEAPWGWSKGDRANLYKLVDRHAVELDPDVQLHRGVSAANPEAFDPDWSPGVEVKHTDLPVIPTTTSRGMAYDFATMIGDSPNNAVLNFNRKGPFRAMPIPQSGQDEWLLLPGQSVVRDRKHIPGPFKGYDEILEVDVDFNQYPTVIKYEDGGSVKDLCSGGVAAVNSMKAKYAGGGKVGNTLQAIKEAIAHLDNGDTGAALRVLHSSPGALNDPGIAEAVKKLRHPSTARGGRRVLDAAVTKDTEKAKVATFAKGGKVSNVTTVVEKAKKLTNNYWSELTKRKARELGVSLKGTDAESRRITKKEAAELDDAQVGVTPYKYKD